MAAAWIRITEQPIVVGKANKSQGGLAVPVKLSDLPRMTRLAKKVWGCCLLYQPGATGEIAQLYSYS
eukprot:2387439-Rhodomonas_salina.5